MSHFGFIVLLVATGCHAAREKQWEGRLVFSEEFQGGFLRKHYWDAEEGCEGKGYRDNNLECFRKGTNNVQVENGTLIITARPEDNKEYMMGEYKQEKMKYTSGKVIQSGFGFSHGTYVVKARLPRGKQLLPAIYLLPMGQRENTCFYEEIDILMARGQRTSTLTVGAHHGASYVSVVSKTMEKVFRGVDFSKEFHEFALKWMPSRLEWYVDGKKIYEASTHFPSDWKRSDIVIPKCGNPQQPVFQQRSMLVLSLSVGGHQFPESKYGTLTRAEANAWEKPTLEVDWVKVYDPKVNPGVHKMTVFNITGIDGIDLIY